MRQIPLLLATPGPQIHVKRGKESAHKHKIEVTVKHGSAVYMTYTEGLPGDLVNPTQTYIIDDWETLIEGQESNHITFSGNLHITMTSMAQSFGMKKLSLTMVVGQSVDEVSGQYTLHVDGTTDLYTSQTQVSFEILESGLESRFPSSPVRMVMSTATEPQGVGDYVTWELGHPDVIYCTGYSYPAPSLLLLKDGWTVGSGEGHYAFIKVSADHTTLTFVIQQVDDGYQGKYECVASAQNGQEFTKEVNIEVV